MREDYRLYTRCLLFRKIASTAFWLAISALFVLFFSVLIGVGFNLGRDPSMRSGQAIDYGVYLFSVYLVRGSFLTIIACTIVNRIFRPLERLYLRRANAAIPEDSHDVLAYL